MGVGRKYRTPLATILAHFFRLVHITSTYTPVASATWFKAMIGKFRYLIIEDDCLTARGQFTQGTNIWVIKGLQVVVPRLAVYANYVIYLLYIICIIYNIKMDR